MGRLVSRFFHPADDNGSLQNDNTDWAKRSFDLVKAEYETVRAESAQARQAQQSILQWSLATIGVTLTAGILLINSMAALDPAQHRSRFLYAVFIFLYGLALPVGSWLSCLAWFGELIRMERAGRYLRGLEVVVHALLLKEAPEGHERSYLRAPLRWETYIASENMRGIGVAKQRVGYLGSLGLYTGASTLPLAALCGRVWMEPLFWDHRWQQILVTAYAMVILIGFTVTATMLVRALQRAGRQIADIDQVCPGSTPGAMTDPLM
ncbi:hypothetical protein Q2K19_25705 [Micromonospora soli]|uniref:hypothetical protein n=1 Tax=Micromonospora sp. NBRC 110009 TaxID=3061627 RepID=UPI0026714268|nr:hypothetical protein [Micromonospora sp. NBRC 110009]WKT97545.1 hypothetical protein Q2K19_25705 [Micromonospora sp. NBRC 110009]